MKIREESQAVIKSPKGFLAVKKLNGEWRLLKGGIEDGETPEEALRREIREELEIKNVEILERLHKYDFQVDGIKHVVHSFLVETSEISVKIEEEELQDFQWLNVKDLKERVTFDNERKAIRKALE